ncbi:hypothetical protein J5491_03760 [Candidatus Saccharibacteria bacterium]|nr:hypothetical protein [Candidatus Saccharibacteria bacterium]
MDKNNEISAEALASAFQDDSKKQPTPEAKAPKEPKEKKKTKKTASIIVLVLGIIVLIAGLVMLILKLTKGAGISDAEYLVSAKEWVLSDGANCEGKTDNNSDGANCESGVIWKFTDIGKGTLTTNNHTNDYSFIWALENGTLKVNTEWLYALNNEYTYKLDKGAGTLTLEKDDETVTFKRIEDEEKK